MLKIKNVKGLEEMLCMCCEGNDSELDYCYLNDEYGDEELIEDWGNNVFKSYNELLSILNENNVYEYESKEYGKFKFELENNEIKVIFVE